MNTLIRTLLILIFLPVSISGQNRRVPTHESKLMPAWAQRVMEKVEVLDNNTVNVKTFGAKGDGVIDDSAAFNAAIATGKNVIVPPGTYAIASTLKFQATGIKLKGAGMWGRTRLLWRGVAGGTMIYMGPDTSPPTQLYDFGLYDLMLDGNYVAATAVHILGGINHHFDSVLMYKCRGTSFRIGDDPTFAGTFNHVRFDNILILARKDSTGLVVDQGSTEYIHFNSLGIALAQPSGSDSLLKTINIKNGHVSIHNLVTSSGPQSDYAVESSWSVRIDSWRSEDAMPLRLKGGGNISHAILSSVNPIPGEYSIQAQRTVGSGITILDGIQVANKPGASVTPNILLSDAQGGYARVVFIGSIGGRVIVGNRTIAIVQQDGNLILQGSTGKVPAFKMFGANGDEDVYLSGETTNGGLRMPEVSDPPAPPANYGQVYFRNNGSGKTQLVVRFPNGAIQVIATEP